MRILGNHCFSAELMNLYIGRHDSICCYIAESKLIWLIVLLIVTSYLNLIYLMLANTVNVLQPRNTATVQDTIYHFWLESKMFFLFY